MVLMPETLSDKDRYKLVGGVIVPRPIAWVSTISVEGIANLAPFSNFMPCAWAPPSLCFSIGAGVKEDRCVRKDTLTNILSTREFVVNIVSLPLGEAMMQTGEVYPPETSEFTEAGLTAMPCERVAAPRVGESKASLECRLDRVIEVGRSSLVIGEIVCFHIDDDIYIHPYKINVESLKPIGRLSGDYTFIEHSFSLKAPNPIK